MASKTSSRYRPPDARRSAAVSERGRRIERERERQREREAARRARFGDGPLPRRVFDALVVDAPRWNATWAALLVVVPVAWILGAWLLPALNLRPRSDLEFVYFANRLPSDSVLPEPLEQQRYLLTLLAALTVVPCALLIARRRALDAVTRFAPAAGLLAVVVIGGISFARGHRRAEFFFSMGPWMAAAAVVVLAFMVVAAARAGRVRWLALAVDRGSRRRVAEVAGIALALLFAAAVTSPGIYNDHNVLLSAGDAIGNMQFTYEEAASVASGHTPLVDYTPQYTVLLAWLLAPVYRFAPPSLEVFTLSMAALGTVALMSLYFTFRLVTGTAARALLLFLPPMTAGFVTVDRRPAWNVSSITTYFALMPMRELGPFALALATVVVVGAARSRRNAVLLGAGAGAVVLMNVEFGLFAAAAAVLAVAMLNDDPRPVVRRTAVLAAELAAGAAAVLIAFVLLTFARSGSPPDLGQLTYFQRQFGAAGFFMLPMDHLLEFHTLVFATFAASAIAGLGIVAFGAVRPGVHGRRSAALLIYAGVFGFGAFEYYMGRTHPVVLGSTFLPWGVALSALCWEAGCRVAAGGVTARAVRPIAVVLVAGTTVLAVDAVRHLDYTVHQPARILGESIEFPLWAEPDGIRAVRDCVPPGTNTLIFADMPDRIAHGARVHNWLPYANPGSIVTQQQVDETFSVAARHHVDVVVDQQIAAPQLLRHGFVPVRGFVVKDDIAQADSYSTVTEIWVRRGARNAVDCHGAGKPMS